ncbi:MAG TPA: FecR family protein [Candidatus Methylacidiphilales bacterium]|nr:FecR family protein [Candidatus Methylacidiphilales bacterium]
MKIPQLMTMALLAGTGQAVASATDAKVTESVNHVSYGPSQASVETYPAPEGTLVQSGAYVETGGDHSRAELTFPTRSIARLGENTIFNYNESANQVDLTAGTILFCKRKDAPEELHIKTEALTAGITGTTGFVQVDRNKACLFGLIEGHATILAHGRSFPIKSAQLLLVRPGMSPQLLNFDLPKFVGTFPLITEFKPLPNWPYIAEAEQQYNDDVQRGFIQPSGKTAGTLINLPAVQLIAIDSAQNAQRGGGPAGSSPSRPSNPSGGP